MSNPMAAYQYTPMFIRITEARKLAAEIRARNFPRPCDCAGCTTEENLAAVQRILLARSARNEADQELPILASLRVSQMGCADVGD